MVDALTMKVVVVLAKDWQIILILFVSILMEDFMYFKCLSIHKVFTVETF